MNSYKNCNLHLSGKIVVSPLKIIKVIDLKNVVLVLIEESTKFNKQIPSNLFLYNSSGEKIWEAELPKEMSYSTYEPEYYYSIYFENNELSAYSDRWFCILDIVNGKIKSMYPNK